MNLSSVPTTPLKLFSLLISVISFSPNQMEFYCLCLFFLSLSIICNSCWLLLLWGTFSPLPSWDSCLPRFSSLASPFQCFSLTVHPDVLPSPVLKLFKFNTISDYFHHQLWFLLLPLHHRQRNLYIPGSLEFQKYPFLSVSPTGVSNLAYPKLNLLSFISWLSFLYFLFLI